MTTARAFDSEEQRLEHFGRAIGEIHRRVQSEVGASDVRRIVRLQRFCRVMEVAGRLLIHASPEPVSFGLGVGCLWVYKQLQTTEIGHTVLHGAYDKLPGAEAFRSATYVWEAPIDEASWRAGHNHKHHQFTNVAGRDPDINFGGIRLTAQTPYRRGHATQLASVFLVSWPFFTWSMNMHFTGMMDVYGVQGWADRFDVIETRDRATVISVHKRALRKWGKKLAIEYVLFPALAGPFFWKVALGNWLSERMRDVYSAATIYCGHVGDEVASYPEGTRAGSRGRWYAMQVEASNNFEVAWPFNVLCGGLEHQIEHHLFPKLPPERLRQVAPEVAAACAEHGVTYRSASWGRTLAKSIRHLAALSGPTRDGDVPRPSAAALA